MKKLYLFSMMCLMASPFFTGCGKDAETNIPWQPTTYTYVYDNTGIPRDTVLAHTDVDTFYVIPTRPDLFAGASENGVHTVRNHLENHTLVNPKMRGKGVFKVRHANDSDSTWLANFGYQVITF